MNECTSGKLGTSSMSHSSPSFSLPLFPHPHDHKFDGAGEVMFKDIVHTRTEITLLCNHWLLKLTKHRQDDPTNNCRTQVSGLPPYC